jgi:hypothetical protein
MQPGCRLGRSCLHQEIWPRDLLRSRPLARGSIVTANQHWLPAADNRRPSACKFFFAVLTQGGGEYALPWAEKSQAVGLKTGSNGGRKRYRSLTCLYPGRVRLAVC